jgi:Cu+-exporting ATPase
MDCAECTQHVRHAIAALSGVASVDVFLASERARIRLDPERVSLDAIRNAVADAGYSVPKSAAGSRGSLQALEASSRGFTRQVGVLLAILFGVILFVVVIGEWLGFFAQIMPRVPWPIGVAIVIAAGYPAFRNVVRATLKRQIISHMLMTVGVIAALAVGQLATALVVVFFMRVGDLVERFTTERARRVLRDLAALAPSTARVVRDATEVEVPVELVWPGYCAWPLRQSGTLSTRWLRPCALPLRNKVSHCVTRTTSSLCLGRACALPWTV